MMDETHKPQASDQEVQQDEEKMDRAAQAGTTGAFGAGTSTSGTTTDNMRQDAEDAFGGAAEGEESASGQS